MNNANKIGTSLPRSDSGRKDRGKREPRLLGLKGERLKEFCQENE